VVVVVILKVQKSWRYIIDIRGDDTYFENPQNFDILPPKGSKSRSEVDFYQKKWIFWCF